AGSREHLEQVGKPIAEPPGDTRTDHPRRIVVDQLTKAPTTHPRRPVRVGSHPHLGHRATVRLDPEEGRDPRHRAPVVVLGDVCQAIHGSSSLLAADVTLAETASAPPPGRKWGRRRLAPPTCQSSSSLSGTSAKYAMNSTAAS